MYGRKLNQGFVNVGAYGDKFSMPANNTQSETLHIPKISPPIFSLKRFMLNQSTIIPKLTVQVSTQEKSYKTAEKYSSFGRNGREDNQIISLPRGYVE